MSAMSFKTAQDFMAGLNLSNISPYAANANVPVMLNK